MTIENEACKKLIHKFVAFLVSMARVLWKSHVKVHTIVNWIVFELVNLCSDFKKLSPFYIFTYIQRISV